MEIKLFISYSTVDFNKKNALKRAIAKRNGLKPIVVEDYRQNGIEFTEKVKNNLLNATYFIPILTAKSFQKSQWLNQEIGFAFSILPKENILPIVQNSIIPKLKGFIHDKAEISYNFQAHADNIKKERTNFRKCIKSLIDDIQEREKLKNITGLAFIAVQKNEYTPTKISFDRVLTEDLKLHVRIVLSSLQQEFRFYCKILTDKKEEIWIGFTDTQLKPGGYIIQKENSQQILQNKNTNYELSIPLLKTVLERIEMMNNTKYKIEGKPYKLITLQFRGDPQIHEPIHFYYAFE